MLPIQINAPQPIHLGIRLGFFVLSATLLSAAAAAQTSCPWINTATASGLLGGPATSSVKLDPTSQTGTCSFKSQRTQQQLILTITMQTIAGPPASFAQSARTCSSPATPTLAIGNEALTCAVRSQRQSGERIVARVRDRLFTITISTFKPHPSPADHATLKSSLQAAAEQVSGNLY